MLTLSFNFFAFVRVNEAVEKNTKIVLFCWLAQGTGQRWGDF